ncbi:hypothetical protein SKAU_G00268000 [Synaphobranchus kaupii]|uniref:Uncharacterized protein n=1 Tax=Synaphobranchus kaupii TaxID=118154 RepID=A0A9Q1IQA7_SYNKA|nr:hypothetical protein SKAU_G00268000 [Synaphobranchus kaupii]
MPLVKTPESRTPRSAMPQRSLKSSESQKTSPQQSVKYLFRPPPTEPMYIPLKDGLVLHKDVELWVSEEVQSEGQLLSSMTTGSPNHNYGQGRTGLVEFVPQKSLHILMRPFKLCARNAVWDLIGAVKREVPVENNGGGGGCRKAQLSRQLSCIVFSVDVPVRVSSRIVQGGSSGYCKDEALLH